MGKQKEVETKDAVASDLKRIVSLPFEVTEETNFDVPGNIARCIDCATLLNVEVDGWTADEENEGYWKADSITLWCGRWEKCVEEQHYTSQTDAILNQRKIIYWLNENYRWPM